MMKTLWTTVFYFVLCGFVLAHERSASKRVEDYLHLECLGIIQRTVLAATAAESFDKAQMETIKLSDPAPVKAGKGARGTVSLIKIHVEKTGSGVHGTADVIQNSGGCWVKSLQLDSTY